MLSVGVPGCSAEEYVGCLRGGDYVGESVGVDGVALAAVGVSGSCPDEASADYSSLESGEPFYVGAFGEAYGYGSVASGCGAGAVLGSLDYGTEELGAVGAAGDAGLDCVDSSGASAESALRGGWPADVGSAEDSSAAEECYGVGAYG